MTAKEFLKTLPKDSNWELSSIVENAMIEFAKYHVKEALNDIYEKAKHGDEEHQLWLKEFFDNYPLNNIK